MAAAGDTVVPGPMPGTAAAMGAFDDEDAVATDDVALVVPALVVTAVLGANPPSWAGPAAAIEIRLWVPFRCVGRVETGCWEAAGTCEGAVSLDGPAMGNWAGRLVSFR